MRASCIRAGAVAGVITSTAYQQEIPNAETMKQTGKPRGENRREAARRLPYLCKTRVRPFLFAWRRLGRETFKPDVYIATTYFSVRCGPQKGDINGDVVVALAAVGGDGWLWRRKRTPDSKLADLSKHGVSWISNLARPAGSN